MATDLEDRARAVRLLLLDADGVLSDGSLLVSPTGEEWKVFNSRDGLGIQLARHAGLQVGVLSGRRSAALELRARELGLEEVHQGVKDKLRVFEAVLKRLGVEPGQAAFVGDDLVDVPVLRRAGFAAAVADAAEEVRRHAHLVTTRRGGAGAVREVVEFILKAQGSWQAVLERYGAL